jgi:pimeloyl-ACP methyl ester carboxylesterase
MIQSIQSMMSHFPLETLIAQIEAMLTDASSLHYHSSIKAPTLVLHSRQDALFPKEHELLLTGIKNSTLAIIEDCGHASLVEKPDEITNQLLSFLQKKL